MLRYDTHMHLALRAAGYSTSDLEEIKRRLSAEPTYLATLRDEFAKAAMVGMLADSAANAREITSQAEKRGMSLKDSLATAAYEHADAMLAARGKGGAQ